MRKSAGGAVLALTMASGAVAGDGEASSSGLNVSSGFKFDGYLEASFNRLSSDGIFASGVPSRVFDADDGVSMQRVGLGAEFLPMEGIGGRIDVNLGKDAIGMAPVESYPGTAKIDLTQAYVRYAAGHYTVMAGKMITLLGVEYLQSPLDANFSRSILFGYATPFTHVGIRTSYSAGDALTAYAGINNGWDHLPGKSPTGTLELGLIAAPLPTVSLAATAYIGTERSPDMLDGAGEGRRYVLDLVTSWRPRDALTLTFNCNWAAQRHALLDSQGRAVTASWSGQAAYLSYAVSRRWNVSLRAENFVDRDGYRTGIVQRWRELTATIGFAPSRHLQFRGELRGDASDARPFTTSHGADVDNRQRSVALQVLVIL